MANKLNIKDLAKVECQGCTQQYECTYFCIKENKLYSVGEF